MKKIIFLLLIIGLESCSSQKKIETTNQYFDTGASSIQEWIGGRPESGSGFNLKIALINQSEDISFEEIYFRNRILPCELKEEGEVLYLLAKYNKTSAENPSNDMHEAKTEKKFPFLLQPTEAIIGYTKEGQPKKYLKITDIKQKAPLAFPSKPKN